MKKFKKKQTEGVYILHCNQIIDFNKFAKNGLTLAEYELLKKSIPTAVYYRLI